MKSIKYLTLLSLILISAVSCTLKTKNKAAEVNTIQDSYWMLMSLEGEDLPAPNNTRTAYIRFEEGSDEVKGYTGCNRLFGKYEFTEQTVRLTDLSTTRMTCPDINQETKLMDILKQVNAYRISDNVLTLYDNDKAVATFMTGTRRSIDNEVHDELHYTVPD